MKLFLINLDRDKERFAFVDGQLKRLNVDYERVSGVDAKLLTLAERAKAFSPFLEDDVEVSSQLTSTLCAVKQWIDPQKPQVVILNDHQNKYGNLPSGIHRSRFGGTCTDGYVLTRTAAQNLLRANLPIIVPCDTWGRWVRQGRIELYHAVPAVVRQKQDVFGSSTDVNRVNVSKLSLTKWFLYKAKRTVGKALDTCLSKVTGR